MIYKTILLSVMLVFLFGSCGEKTSKKAELQAQEAVKAEVETIDSLSIELDKAANEIEESTKELEDAIKELDNL